MSRVTPSFGRTMADSSFHGLSVIVVCSADGKCASLSTGIFSSVGTEKRCSLPTIPQAKLYWEAMAFINNIRAASLMLTSSVGGLESQIVNHPQNGSRQCSAKRELSDYEHVP